MMKQETMRAALHRPVRVWLLACGTAWVLLACARGMELNPDVANGDARGTETGDSRTTDAMNPRDEAAPDVRVDIVVADEPMPSMDAETVDEGPEPSEIDVLEASIDAEPEAGEEAGPDVQADRVVMADSSDSSSCVAPRSRCGAFCVDTRTDPNHCGACSNACMPGRGCVDGVCVFSCPTDRTVCGSGSNARCVDTRTDDTNCGGCSVSCTGGTRCTSGVCSCPTGQANCGGTCVDVQTSSGNCGTCGNACASDQVCRMGRCEAPCTAPEVGCTTAMGLVCANTQTSAAHCGRCGNACATGQRCLAGVCRNPPPNDLRSGATVLSTIMPTTELNVDLTEAGGEATPPSGCADGCAAGAPDVYYRFTLNQPELIYADTFGSGQASSSATDTILFLQNSSGVNLTSANTTGGQVCNHNQAQCTSGEAMGIDSRVVARLAAGTYHLVLKSCGARATVARLRFHHLPAGNGTSRELTVSTTTGMVSGSTTGTGLLSNSCTSPTGPEEAWWFTTCPSATAQPFHATTCGSETSFDTVVYQRSARRTAELCNDDVGYTCGVRSGVFGSLPAGAGLHAVYVDGISASSLGPYALRFRSGDCVDGFRQCGGTCSPDARFLTDNANCGMCGNACATGTRCVDGACRPPNDDCSGAQNVSLPAVGSTATATARMDGATRSASSPAPGSGTDVWFQFTLTQRELIYLDTFGTTGFDATIAVGNACGTAPTASGDDSRCGTDCGASMGCDYRNPQLAVVLDPGVHYVVVGSYTAGDVTGPVTLRLQRMTGISAPVGTIGATVPSGTYSFSSNTNGAPTRAQSCGGSGTATEERTYLWMSCPGTASANFTAQTCTNTAFDTILQYRATHGTASACNDDNCGRQSSISVSVPAGAGAHVLTVSGYGGASGTTTVTGTRP